MAVNILNPVRSVGQMNVLHITRIKALIQQEYGFIVDVATMV